MQVAEEVIHHVLTVPSENGQPMIDRILVYLYGWAKLMGEMTLKSYHQDWGMRCASCRYFTVYGERGHEKHAVIAMIARAFVGQNPFVVWGTGEQVRNWTHVSDIVRGTILAADKIDDGTLVNLGTMERTRVIDAVQEVLRGS
jgi:UDP-glucose 4-epimerase